MKYHKENLNSATSILLPLKYQNNDKLWNVQQRKESTSE
jgi:hypothetical protein